MTEPADIHLLLTAGLRDRLAARLLRARPLASAGERRVRRVTLVMCSLILDGASLQTLELARGLEAKGIATSLICPVPAPQGGFLQLMLRDEQLSRIVRPDPRQGLTFPGGPLAWTRAAIADREPDLVLFYGLQWLPVAVDHERKRIAVVQIAHHQFLKSHLPPLVQETHPVDAVVCVSEELRRRLIRAGVNPLACRTIWNGIDPQRVQATVERSEMRRGWGFAEEHFVAGYLGRLVNLKGMDLLSDLLEQPWHPSVRLVIVGRGPAEQDLRRRIADLGLERQVVLAEPRNDVAAFYGGVDVLVHPSKSEGLPLTVLEAMHAGVPVVARPSGGVPEVISDEVSGLFATTAAEFADRLNRLASEPPVRQRLATAAAEFARTWLTADSMAEQYLDLFEDVVASLSPRGSRMLV